jgi:hypothetical protein
MIRIKKFSSKENNDKKSNLSKPSETTKKSPNKKARKPNNRRLDADKHLEDDAKISVRSGKLNPSSRKIDGENFLSDDIKVTKFTEAFGNQEEDKNTCAKNYALHVCKDNPEELEAVKNAWISGYDASIRSNNSENPFIKSTLAGDISFPKNKKVIKSKTDELLSDAWEHGHEVCERIMKSRLS